jgi:hypothetical protein
LKHSDKPYCSCSITVTRYYGDGVTFTRSFTAAPLSRATRGLGPGLPGARGRPSRRYLINCHRNSTVTVIPQQIPLAELTR